MTDKHLNKAEAQALAEAVAECMWARDRATNALGMKIEAVRPGYARISMPVPRTGVPAISICPVRSSVAVEVIQARYDAK